MAHKIQFSATFSCNVEREYYESGDDSITFEGSRAIELRPLFPKSSGRSETPPPQVKISQDVQIGCCEKIKKCLCMVFCCNSATDYKPPSLKNAVEKGDVKLVQLILNDFAVRCDLDLNYLKECLHLAYKNNHLKCVELLIANGVSIARFNSNLDTLLHVVIKDIKAHANDLDSKFKTDLKDLAMLIIQNTPRELLMLRNKQGQAPFDYVCHWRLSTLARELLTKISISEHDQQLLFVAISNRDQALARDMIESDGFCFNVQHSNGDYPLIAAAKHGCQDIIAALIENGASIHCKDKEGRTSLYYANQNKHPEIARLLIEAGHVNHH